MIFLEIQVWQQRLCVKKFIAVGCLKELMYISGNLSDYLG